MVVHLKRRVPQPKVTSAGVLDTVRGILETIEAEGETAVLRYAEELDGVRFASPAAVRVTDAQMQAAEAALPESLKRDIRAAHASIRTFADAQRRSVQDLSLQPGELGFPGLAAGHRMRPVACAGCYAPGGRFAHLASALMTVTTARAAGVQTVVLCSPPRPDTGAIHDAVLYAARVAGADIVLVLGGVQALAAMAFGLFGVPRAAVVVGPGNRFIVAAKQLLFGRVGIDLIAGPTEVCVLADDSADPLLVATDLVGQAEHGFDSPAVLITTSRTVAERVVELVGGSCGGRVVRAVVCRGFVPWCGARVVRLALVVSACIGVQVCAPRLHVW
jgi:sulfopropanediol 3-dehydrogenase